VKDSRSIRFSVVLCVLMPLAFDDFRNRLGRLVPILSRLQCWTLRLVFPLSLRRAVVAHQTVVHEELESRLDADRIRELQHYFFHRRRGTDLTTLPESLRARLTRYSEVYAGPRFIHLYRRWLTGEQAAFTPVSSAIHAALADGRAAVECVVLPHTYDHLFPLVARQLSRRLRNTADAEEGDETPHSINPSLNPVP